MCVKNSRTSRVGAGFAVWFQTPQPPNPFNHQPPTINSTPQEKHTISLGFTAEGISGGALVSARGTDFIVFYDWDGKVVRRIDVAVGGGRRRHA